MESAGSNEGLARDNVVSISRLCDIDCTLIVESLGE